MNRYRLHIWHAYSTNDALSNDTKVKDFDLRDKNSSFRLAVVSKTYLDLFSFKFSLGLPPNWAIHV